MLNKCTILFSGQKIPALNKSQLNRAKNVLHSPIWFQPNQKQGELTNQAIKLKMISEIC